jgi:hypothetical protein
MGGSDDEDADEYNEGYEPTEEIIMDMDDSGFEGDLSDWQDDEDELEFPMQY